MIVSSYSDVFNNINERLNRNEYKDKVNIMKCYKLFSKWKYLKDDLSLWFFGIINVINVCTDVLSENIF